jgi:hypothetical protein
MVLAGAGEGTAACLLCELIWCTEHRPFGKTERGGAIFGVVLFANAGFSRADFYEGGMAPAEIDAENKSPRHYASDPSV